MQKTLTIALGLTIAACGDGSTSGELGLPCHDDGTCNGTLVCVERVCRAPDAEVDAAMADGGAVVDASSEPDDATIGVDGSTDDSGISDAGMVDAGVPEDAAMTDAGMSAMLPFDLVLPAGTHMTSLTRLGDDAFVIASLRDTDTTSPETEELALQLVRRVGHDLVVDPASTLPELGIDPGSDNAIALMDAIGPEHFFVILRRPDWTAVIRFFAYRGGAFVDLGSRLLAAGGDFGPATPDFFHGHPVDDTRYLLGYREGSSAQPYRYRLIVRAADAYSFGPAVVRPPPTAFGALASNESQTDPALFRVGPTTFVEARPGYVQLPGNLGSWTLEVLPDGSLTATAPTVHATVTQTMIPEVAADGSGRALIAYHTYLDEDWQYGLYTHAGRELMVRGILASSADVSVRTHQGESTDRYLGGAYYLRLPGSASNDAPLLRVDASDGSVTRLPDVPSLYYCSRVPQMVRAGTVAAYAACDHVHFVDLLPRCGNGVVEVPETCDDANNSDGDGCSAGCTS